MGNFGEAVTSLVDTYSRCLAFLKLSSRGKELRGTTASSDSASELHSALRRSRNKVRRGYSSRLSDRGQSFEKGDATSRSSLRHIIRKLRNTLSSIQGAIPKGSRHSPGVDYASLVSLCESSRSDAMRTMSSLSDRISTRSASTISRRSRRPRHDHDRDRTRAKASDSRSRRPHRKRGDGTESKRVSKVSMSSDSTKLGEVRRKHLHNAPSHVAYPRQSLQVGRGRIDQGKKRWWDILS